MSLLPFLSFKSTSFFILFPPPAPLKRRSERAAGWVPGSQPRLSHHIQKNEENFLSNCRFSWLGQSLKWNWWGTILNFALSWKSTEKILSSISWTCFWFSIFIKLFAYSKHLLLSSYEILFAVMLLTYGSIAKNNCSTDWSEETDFDLFTFSLLFACSLTHITVHQQQSAVVYLNKSYCSGQDTNLSIFV